jgi:hypothetical protein
VGREARTHNGEKKMTTRNAQAAYLHALNIANKSGATPGLDQWWAILKAEEAAQMARILKAEKAEKAEKAVEEAAEIARFAAEDARYFGQTTQEWAAWTYSVAGLERDRWTRAHLIINGETACGRAPKGEARWGHEVDAGTGRCKACERRA